MLELQLNFSAALQTIQFTLLMKEEDLARISPYRYQLLGQHAGTGFAIDGHFPVDLVCRYNAYRFLVQNVHRWQSATGKIFSATAAVTDSHQANVMDRWISASTRLLVSYVRCIPCHPSTTQFSSCLRATSRMYEFILHETVGDQCTRALCLRTSDPMGCCPTACGILVLLVGFVCSEKALVNLLDNRSGTQ